ncbi:chloride channel protein [Pediococcus stilesii]|uniref:Chloride channel protein n=1 Tax=Pediococcus stilesii TaxID=331679 RepID=A0A0R2L7A0_9LACO|nr:chloride channel protein [Pediococcus stilesii]KRN94749.1 hypothetical protein IV81_GL001025 [Pediococcus stilesii]
MYGLFCALVMGSLLGLFYLFQGWLINQLWPGETFRVVFNAVLILIVGIVIFVTKEKIGDMPKKLSEIKLELYQTGTANFRYLPLQLLIPPIILCSGTSLGPEATLVSSTVLFGVWISEKQRYLSANWRDNRPLDRLKIMVTPHRYLKSRSQDERQLPWWTPKMISYLGIGIGAFYLTCKWGGEQSVIVYLGSSNWKLIDLLWLVPIAVVAFLVGQICLRAMILIQKGVLERFITVRSSIIFGGVMIYLATLFVPNINFSGMVNFELLASTWQSKSAIFLIVNAFLKLVLLTICLNTGWLGGEIFPVLFSATIQGIVFSRLLPQVDPIFFIGVFAITEGAVILESPWIAGGVMSVMFLPPNLLPVSISLTAILIGLRKIHLKRIHQKSMQQELNTVDEG